VAAPLVLAQAVGAGEALCAQRARVRPVSAVCGHVSAQVAGGAERPLAQVAAEHSLASVITDLVNIFYYSPLFYLDSGSESLYHWG